jgi:hypothetical protein
VTSAWKRPSSIVVTNNLPPYDSFAVTKAVVGRFSPGHPHAPPRYPRERFRPRPPPGNSGRRALSHRSLSRPGGNGNRVSSARPGAGARRGAEVLPVGHARRRGGPPSQRGPARSSGRPPQHLPRVRSGLAPSHRWGSGGVPEHGAPGRADAGGADRRGRPAAHARGARSRAPARGGSRCCPRGRRHSPRRQELQHHPRPQAGAHGLRNCLSDRNRDRQLWRSAGQPRVSLSRTGRQPAGHSRQRHLFARRRAVRDGHR